MNEISSALNIQPIESSIWNPGNLSLVTPVKVGVDFLADSEKCFYEEGSQALESRVTTISDAYPDAYYVGSVICLSALAVYGVKKFYDSQKNSRDTNSISTPISDIKPEKYVVDDQKVKDNQNIENIVEDSQDIENIENIVEDSQDIENIENIVEDSQDIQTKSIDVPDQSTPKYHKHNSGHLVQVDKNGDPVFNEDFYNYNLVNEKGEVQRDKQGRIIHVETQGDLTVISDQGNRMLVRPGGSRVMVENHHVLVTRSGDHILATEEGNPVVKMQEDPYEGNGQQRIGVNSQNESIDKVKNIRKDSIDQEKIETKSMDVPDQSIPKYHKHNSGHLVQVDKNGNPVINGGLYNLVNEKSEVQTDKEGRTIHVSSAGYLIVINDRGNRMLVNRDGSRVKVEGHHVLLASYCERKILATEKGDPVKIQEGPHKGACIHIITEDRFYLVDDQYYRFIFKGDGKQVIRVDSQGNFIGYEKS